MLDKVARVRVFRAKTEKYGPFERRSASHIFLGPLAVVLAEQQIDSFSNISSFTIKCVATSWGAQEKDYDFLSSAELWLNNDITECGSLFTYVPGNFRR